MRLGTGSASIILSKACVPFMLILIFFSVWSMLIPILDRAVLGPVTKWMTPPPRPVRLLDVQRAVIHARLPELTPSVRSPVSCLLLPVTNAVCRKLHGLHIRLMHDGVHPWTDQALDEADWDLSRIVEPRKGRITLVDNPRCVLVYY